MAVFSWILERIGSCEVNVDARSEAQLVASPALLPCLHPIGQSCAHAIAPAEETVLLAIGSTRASVAAAPTCTGVTDQNAPVSAQQCMAHAFQT